MPEELATAIDAAQEAGRILRGYFQADFEIRDKGFHNPVTTADYASNKYLEDRLRSEFPGYGWLSEETEDTTERLSQERLWVVDPLDGTKEFIEGVPQFVVSIALVENGAPIVGVLVNPITEELFSAAGGPLPPGQAGNSTRVEPADRPPGGDRSGRASRRRVLGAGSGGSGTGHPGGPGSLSAAGREDVGHRLSLRPAASERTGKSPRPDPGDLPAGL